MRVLMLGFEFPPYMAGGLGVACQGLTAALARQGIHITFVLPKAVAAGCAILPNLRLLPVGNLAPVRRKLVSMTAAAAATGMRTLRAARSAELGKPAAVLTPGQITFRAVSAALPTPYQSAGGQLHAATAAAPVDPEVAAINILGIHRQPSRAPTQTPSSRPGSADPLAAPPPPPRHLYEVDLFGQVERYAELCAHIGAQEEFDLVHAHDWVTFPAGQRLAAMSGKPLIVHVHSTEYDRSGEHMNPHVFAVERAGMQAADLVVAVSHMTGSILQRLYGVPRRKIHVVYNGIDSAQVQRQPVAGMKIKKTDKIVLFLGRITMQKGPEYFVAAAKRVLEKLDSVKFIMAGSGDMIMRVIELAAQEGIGHKVLFTGFLRGDDVERVLRMADVFVMPSVSEPFGIAALEAIRHEVPVIISKTAGVSEVVRHALKVDFWDIDGLANKILAVLRHPPLARMLRQQAEIEVRKLTWDEAARQCLGAYAAAGGQGAEIGMQGE